MGGIRIACDRKAVAHSDGDALLHALCDALLSAAGKPDIGHYFPDTDERWRNASSRLFVERVMEILTGEGWQVVNVSCVVILASPRLSPYLAQIREHIGTMIGTGAEKVGLTATTPERTPLLGGENSYAAICSVLIARR